MGDKLHSQEGNSPDPPLRSLNLAKCRRKWEHRDSQDVGLEAATIERVRNSLLADVVPRRKCKGAHARYRSVGGWPVMAAPVGERAVVGRSRTVRSGGRSGSEYAGMSSEKSGENPLRRKPKVS